MIYSSILDISHDFDTYVLDAYGVFNFGNVISDSAVDIMRTLINRSKQLYILSNSSATHNEAMQYYKDKGVFKGIHYNDIVTSGRFINSLLKNGDFHVKGKKVYILGRLDVTKPNSTLPTFLKAMNYQLVDKVSNADFAYCAYPYIDNNNTFDISSFLPEIQSLKDYNLPLVCVNPDIYAIKFSRFLSYSGNLAREYEKIGGEVSYFGKPEASIFEYLFRKIPNFNLDSTLMIGDTINTDILGAKRAGIKSCLVLKEGVTKYTLEASKLAVNEENIQKLSQEYNAFPDFIAHQV